MDWLVRSGYTYVYIIYHPLYTIYNIHASETYHQVFLPNQLVHGNFLVTLNDLVANKYSLFFKLLS